jgi:hypothetical protein
MGCIGYVPSASQRISDHRHANQNPSFLQSFEIFIAPPCKRLAHKGECLILRLIRKLNGVVATCSR